MSNEIVKSDHQPAGSDDSRSLEPIEGSRGNSSGNHGNFSRAQIEHIRNTDFDRYEREGLDKQLIRLAREDAGELAPTDPMPASTSRALMETTVAGRYLARTWDRGGGFQQQLGRVQNDIGALVRTMGDDRHQRAFMERFDRLLPEPVRLAVFDVLTTPIADGAPPADADGVRHFSADAAAAQLVKEWGTDAPMKIGRIWRRFDYLEQLTGTMSHVRAWYDQLSDIEARAVLEFASR